MKKLLIILFILFSINGYSQNTVPQFLGGKNSNLIVQGILNLADSAKASMNWILYDTATTKSNFSSNLKGRWARQNNRLYYNPNGTRFVLADSVTGGGSTIDTTSLSNRIDARVKYTDTAAMLSPYALKTLVADTAAAIRSSIPNVSGKVNYTDTASMLVPYLRKADTASLSNRINLKLNISDTANMLAPYYRSATATAALALKQNYTDTTTWDATKKNLADTASALRALIPSSIDTTSLSNRIDARVKYADTASMLVGYVRAARLNDTASAIRSSIPNVSGKVNYTDTSAMLTPYLRKADTTAMLLPYARKTLVADTAAAIRASIPNVSGKVNYTDTAAMLAPYATDAQLALKLNIVDTANMRLRPIAGSNMTISGTYPNLTFAASGGGSTIDTTSLSNRIDARVKYTDTASMLSPYYRTATATAALATKVNYTDTASMLTPYLRSALGVKYADTASMLGGYLKKVDTATLSNRINLKLNIADTASMLTNYARKTLVNDTAAAIRAAIPNVSGKVNYTDTAAMLAPYYRTATATAALALKQNYTDTTTYDATKKNLADTALALRALIPSGVDTTSLSNRIDARVKYTDTSAMLGGYLRKVDTASLSNRINLKFNTADTANKWVNSVVKLNDSTIRVTKNTTITDITLTPTSTVTSATRLITAVYNKSGAAIAKGSVVYIDGAHSSVLPSIALAKANAESTSAYTYGLVENDIPNNSQGVVIQSGAITNLNLPTSTYTDGQTLYLSPTVAGGYTLVKPLAPNHYVSIGTITRAHPTLGTIQIAIRNGFQLDELSDVQIPLVPNDSDLLQFTRVDSLWKNVSVTTAIGNKYIKPSDTSAMLTSYLRKVDTASLSTRINTKLNSADTASLSNRINLRVRYIDTESMLSPYYRTSVATAALATKVNYTDTATMLGGYLRKIDTTTLSTRIDARVKYTDTSSMLVPYLRKGDTSAMLAPYYRTATATAALASKLNYTDTAAMLGGYLRKVDTSTLSTRINARVAYADTATMLSPYYRTATATASLALKQNFTDTTSWDATKKNLADSSAAIRGAIPSISGKVNYTDTAAMLGGYLRKVDTSTLSNRINLKLNSADTASLSNRINLKLNSADTASLSTRIDARVKYSDTSAMLGGYLRKVDTASLSTRINGKVDNGTLTTNYVPKATSTTAIGNSQIFDNGTSVGINTATPNAAFKLDVNGKGRFQTSCLINSTVDYSWPFQVNNQSFRILNDGTFGRSGGLSYNNETWNLAAAGPNITYQTSSTELVIINQAAATRINPFGVNYTNRPVIIGNTTARTEKLQVDGTSYFSGSTLVGTGTANASALLEVNSTTQGLGLPSMTTTQQNAIATPRTGLEIYNSTLLTPQFYNGTVWTGGWNKRGNAGTDAASDFIGTTDGVDVVFKRANVTSGWLNGGLANTSFGVSSMPTTTTSQNSVAFGHSALSALTTGGSNSAFGRSALAACSTGANNVAIGNIALQTLTTGGNNIAVGSGGVLQQNNGNNNTAVGYRPMLTNTTGANNSAYGYQAMYSNLTGNNNSAFGYEALQNNSVGTDNVAVGISALNRTTGSNNIGIGSAAANFSTTGSNNTTVGHRANLNLGTGENNTALGALSSTSSSTGSNNIAVGYNASASGTGLKNLTVAYSGSVPLSTGSNQMNIGNVLWGADCSGTGTTAAGSLSVGANAPNASAIFDIVSTTKGLGLPSMTTTQQNAIGTPRAGLAVYNSTLAAPTYYNGTAWSTFGGASGWGLTGNAGTSAATNFIGTTDNVDFIIKANNVERAKFSPSSGSIGLGSSTVLGFNSTSIGNSSSTNGGTYAISAGFSSSSTNYGSSSFGMSATSSANFATSIGYSNIAAAESSTSLGNGCVVSSAGTNSIAIGYNSAATAPNSICIGSNTYSTYAGTFVTGDFHRGAGPQASTTNQFKAEYDNGFIFTKDATTSNNVTIFSNSDASSAISINDVTKGLGLPQMTTTQINAIASPRNGLTVYNTTLALICFYNGTAWQRVAATPM
jgi:hypothetical protein